jgi:hypothetical protein
VTAVRAGWRAALLLAVSASWNATVVHASADVERYVGWRAAAARQLAQRSDADSLAAAAALAFFAHPPRARAAATAAHALGVELATRASARAPADDGIAWLRLELCAAAAGCDIRDAATAMRWVDADNGAAWLPTLLLAEREHNAVDVDRILNEMAQTTRFEFHWTRLVVLLFDALRHASRTLPAGYVPTDLARYQEALGVIDAEVLPPLAPLGSLCRSSPEHREPCMRIARRMQHADTVIAQMAGFSLERYWLAPDGREARVLAERRRLLQWRIEAADRADEPLLPWSRNAWARRRIGAMRTIPREEDLLLAVLRQNHLPVEPPASSP